MKHESGAEGAVPPSCTLSQPRCSADRQADFAFGGCCRASTCQSHAEMTKIPTVQFTEPLEKAQVNNTAFQSPLKVKNFPEPPSLPAAGRIPSRGKLAPVTFDPADPRASKELLAFTCPWAPFPEQYISVVIFHVYSILNVNNAQKLFTEEKMSDSKRICKHATTDSLFRPLSFVWMRGWMRNIKEKENNLQVFVRS